MLLCHYAVAKSSFDYSVLLSVLKLLAPPFSLLATGRACQMFCCNCWTGCMDSRNSKWLRSCRVASHSRWRRVASCKADSQVDLGMPSSSKQSIHLIVNWQAPSRTHSQAMVFRETYPWWTCTDLSLLNLMDILFNSIMRTWCFLLVATSSKDRSNWWCHLWSHCLSSLNAAKSLHKLR